MDSRDIATLVIVFGLAAASVGACSKSSPAPDAGACVPCVMDSDCANGGVCAQLGGDSYCATPCPNGDECASNQTCTSVSTVTGDEAVVCVDPASTTCGPNPTVDAGPAPTCPGFADPSTQASCTSCTQYGKPCQANGCFGGWWCDLETVRCQAPPTSCGSGDGGGPVVYDAAVPAMIGADGGTESKLYFAIVGDTRPATEDDTAHYPNTIIGKIFSDVSAVSPTPPFAVATGDYQFSNPYGSQASAQLQLYLNARATYPGALYPAMGNHECTGATASNCGAGNANGTTNNYSSYLGMMLGPIQKTLPYYAIEIDATDASWTSKFVFVAANAWDQTQATWLDAALAKPTTYTFVVRHEPASANTAPGVTPSETIMANHPYTLSIVGHSHEYLHVKGSRELLVGNGGAPLGTNQDYGYAIVAQRADGSLQVDMFDYQTGAPDTSFRFAVKADGSAAP